MFLAFSLRGAAKGSFSFRKCFDSLNKSIDYKGQFLLAFALPYDFEEVRDKLESMINNSSNIIFKSENKKDENVISRCKCV